MKKIILFLAFIIIPVLNIYSQSKKPVEIFYTPIGRTHSEVRQAGKSSGFVEVNFDEENEGTTEVYEYLHNKNEVLKASLKFYSSSKICYAAIFRSPLFLIEGTIEDFNEKGVRQGVYYHWKFPKQKYEVFINKDEDNEVFYVMMARLKS